ncbi:helix-turn-helix domain-containing protein [Granulicatella elegans]|uniref:helix-turn-helix domain-containing protein n=1 Tax=Granulicatella elegans TaxID=137732 RepID=UPI001D141683|nr:helix-turn-helix domain-containing protein [Granulicatella elegans]UEA30898.1 helix-turn-helix domain-containing protein [Granulicatella elegans]
MHVWIVVVALLALAVFFLFISLFLKDNQYEDELDELSEGLLELNREVYSLKRKIQELEGTPIYRAPVEQAQQPEPEFTFIPQPVVGPEPTFTPRFEEKEEKVQPMFEPKPTVSEPTVSQTEQPEEELHSITRKHILTLFSHGGSYEEIAEQLNLPVSTVQLVIDSYFESDSH